MLCRSPPHCPLWYSLTGALPGMDALAHSWPQGLLKYAFHPVSLITHTLCKVRKTPDLDGCGLLAHLDLVLGAHAPLRSPSLVNSPEEGPSFSGEGHNMVPTGAHHDTVNGKSLKKHDQIIRFLRGVRRLNPQRLRIFLLATSLWSYRPCREPPLSP